MLRLIVALGSGLLFGLGLTISQMVNPAKVIGFLDIAGAWDASLALVMASAIPVMMGGYALARRFPSPLIAPNFNLPARTQIDRPLVLGAILFGIGWGLVGYCPGPALASVLLGNPVTLLFVASMLAGMAGYGVTGSLIIRRAKHA
jgi:uncharacterized membrane protein YedE/YeeE